MRTSSAFGFAADARQHVRDALQKRRHLLFQQDRALAQCRIFVAKVGVAGLSRAVHHRYECVVRSRHDTRPRRVPCQFRALLDMGGKRRVRHIFGGRRVLRFTARRAQNLRARQRTEVFSNFLHKALAWTGVGA